MEHLKIEQSEEIEARAAHVLHWVNLASGQFFADHSSRFNRNGRADQMLLQNLRYLREELKNRGLKDDDICHDLLARVIFVQFLFDRKDRDGNPALTANALLRLQEDGVLKNFHSSLTAFFSTMRIPTTYLIGSTLNSTATCSPARATPLKNEREAGPRRKKLLRRSICHCLLILFVAIWTCPRDRCASGLSMLLTSFHWNS